MKKLVFVLLTSLISFATIGQNLPQIYSSDAFTVTIVSKFDADGSPHTSDVFADGDIIVAYTVEGSYAVGVAKWEEMLYTGSKNGISYTNEPVEGLILLAFLNETGMTAPEQQSGAYFNDELKLAAMKDGNLYAIEHDPIMAQPMNLVYLTEFELTDRIVAVNEVPYFTFQNSRCPEITKTVFDVGEVTTGQVVDVGFRLDYANGYRVELTDGGGEYFMNGSKPDTYKISSSDIQRGFVNLAVIPEWFEDCTEKSTIPLKIKLKGKVVEPEWSDRYWWHYIKYFLDAKVEDGKLVLFYNKKRDGWKDIDFPPMRVEWWFGGVRSPIKVDQTITESGKPVVSYPIPTKIRTGYVKNGCIYVYSAATGKRYQIYKFYDIQ